MQQTKSIIITVAVCALFSVLWLWHTPVAKAGIELWPVGDDCESAENYYGMYGVEWDCRSFTGPARTHIEPLFFAPEEGNVRFDVTNLPEVSEYSDGKEGGSLFTVWDGEGETKNYLNVSHLGWVNDGTDTKDRFRIDFFNRELCVNGQPDVISVEGTTNFGKPDLPVPPAPPKYAVMHIYDHMEVKWDSQSVTLTVQRYWRVDRLNYLRTQPSDLFTIRGDETVSTTAPFTLTLATPGPLRSKNAFFSWGIPFERDRYTFPAQQMIRVDALPLFNYGFSFNNIDLVAAQVTESDELNFDAPQCTIVGYTQPDAPPETCGCGNRNAVIACSDEYAPFVDPVPPVKVGGPTDPVDWNASTYEELLSQVSGLEESFVDNPIVNIGTSRYSPRLDEAFTVNPIVLNYKSSREEIYYGWCVDGHAANGIVAGGLLIDTVVSGSGQQADNGTGCCDTVTRKPESDADGDGMDDAWEKRNGLNPANGEDANSDGDSDGFTADAFVNADNQPVAVVPGSQKYNDASKQLRTGDGSFTNLEEYIWGTNPRDADTDDDGFVDEADIVGVGQQNLELVSQKHPGDFPAEGERYGDDRYVIDLRTAGASQKRRDDTAANSDSPNSAIRVAQSTATFYAREEGDLRVLLDVNPRNFGPESAVVFAADLRDLTKTGGQLKFRWFFQRIPRVANQVVVPDGTVVSFEGDGLNPLSLSNLRQQICQVYGPECTLQPGDTLKVILEVQDTKSSQSYVGEESFGVGTDYALRVYQDKDKSGSAEEITGDQATKDVPVAVSVDLLSGVNLQDYVFEWKLDGENVGFSCASGDPASAASRLGRCGSGSNVMVFTPLKDRETHEILVSVYSQRTEGVPGSTVIFTGGTPIRVGFPQVALSFNPPLPPIGETYAPGTSVTVTATVKYLEKGEPFPGCSADQPFRFIWTFNGKPFPTNAICQDQITVTPSTGGGFPVAVSATATNYLAIPDDLKTAIPFTEEQYIYFGSTPTVGLIDAIQRQFAALVTAIPDSLRLPLQLLAILVVGGSAAGAILVVAKRKGAIK